MYHTNSSENSGSVIIRAAGPVDGAALRRIAQRDSHAVPDGELLIAEVDGEAQAAIALASGEVIADPFRHTAELVRMLFLRRSQLRGEVHGPRGRATVPRLRLG